MKIFKIAIVMSVLMASPAWAADQPKPEQVVNEADFVKLTAEQKLEKLNGMIEAKTIRSSDFSDYVFRLFTEVLSPVKGAQAQIDKYAALKTKYSKLPSVYDLEKTMVMDYLATDPEASKLDIVAQMKKVNMFKEDKKLSWPGVADISFGLLTYHLATNKEFQGKAPLDKVLYLRSLETQKIVSSLTSSDYIRGIALNTIASTGADQKKAEIDKFKSSAGFFAESTIKKAYVDLLGK